MAKYLCGAQNIVRKNGQARAVGALRVGSSFHFRWSENSDKSCRLVRPSWRRRQDLAGARPLLAL